MSKSFDNIIQSGLRATELAVRHGLQDRLPADLLDQLADDIATLQSLVPEALEVRRVAQASTASEQAALAHGYELTRGLRALVRRSGAPAEVGKHYGVGATCSPKVHSEVVSLLEQILNRAEAQPAEATSLGIVSEDLERLRTALSSIHTADRVQRDLKIRSPKTTQSRKDVAARVMHAVRRVSGAGLAQFAGQPAAVEFEGLIARRRRGPSSVPTPTTPNVPLAS
jgi:hypothetical protein